MLTPTCQTDRHNVRRNHGTGACRSIRCAANDNPPRVTPHVWAPGLLAALRHFERRGLGSERSAHQAWHAAAIAGDSIGLAHWASIRRNFGWDRLPATPDKVPSRT